MTAVHKFPTDGTRQRDWLTLFSEACLRISSKQDLDSVLQEVIDSARSLTDARYGALITFDDSGEIKSLMTSGITSEEVQRMGNLPKGLGILGYLNEIHGPLRLTDIASHPRSVGFPKNHPPMKTFLGCPVRYQGERLGNIYLTEKVGDQEFGPEDEKSLMMFASQVALLIVNARRHAEEKQARADLEALVNITPVGVLVFDPKTGALQSTNEETRRIVGKLNAPGRALNQLLEKIALRTPEGRDIPIDELPTTKAVRRGETVFADEVVIHLEDGRTIIALVNARPVYGKDGEIVSVVATLQDITPLEKMKRQRTEILDRVSQDLRTPLTAIKGSTATILSSAHPLYTTEVRQYVRLIDEQAEQMRLMINAIVDMTQIESGTFSVTLASTDLVDLVRQAKEAFSREGATNPVELDLAPDLPRVMADGPRIFQVLCILLKDASEHIPESSTIRVSASLEGLYVSVSVEAGGAGLSADRSPSPFDNFTRGDGGHTGTRIGNDGLSLGICRGIVEAHGGRLSGGVGGPDHGPRLEFTIPVVSEVADGANNGSAPHSADSRGTRGDQARILAVDSDPEERRYIRNTLSEGGFAPVVSGNYDEMDHLIEVERPHLVIVDPMPPWGEGLELMERIRKISDAPVIFVSGHGSGQNMERAFEIGAADYVVKPFTPTELVARINAALRRRQAYVQDKSLEPFVIGDLTIDYAERLVTVAGRRVQLTNTEYRLLFELSNAAGQVMTYEQLLRRAWGPLYSTDARIVHTYVKQLRNKLGDDARRPTYIFTEPRVGYQMASPRRPLRPAEGSGIGGQGRHR